MPIVCETLVLGSGIAGLSFALEAASHGKVLVATKRAADESNTNWPLHPSYPLFLRNVLRTLGSFPAV